MNGVGQGSGAQIGGTIVAMLIAPVVLAVVSIIVGSVAGLFYVLTTVIRAEIIGFFAACLGGGVGVAAARGACDAVLRSYAARVVFVELLALCLIGLGFELLTLPLGWARLAPVAQLLVIAATAHEVFWKRDRAAVTAR